MLFKEDLYLEITSLLVVRSLFHLSYKCDSIEKDLMGGTFSSRVRDEKCIQILDGKPEGS